MRESKKPAAAIKILYALALLISVCLLPSCKPKIPKRNVVLISVDTLRADRLSCYNSKWVKTPNIDALAAAGTLFEENITPVPLTLPGHTVQLTGRYPSETGVRDNGFYKLPGSFPTLATEFKKAGYDTAAIVASHTLNRMYGLDRGFDVYSDMSPGHGRRSYSGDRSERPANEITDEALAWLKKRSDRPFFLWTHYFDPHSPYNPPSPYKEQYPKRSYEGEVAFTDSQVGRLIDGMELAGLSDNTLVVLTADHGESLGEHGENSHGIFLYRSTIHIPLIFKGPGIPAGKRVHTMSRLIDLCPTLLAYTHVNPDFECSGRNLAPIILGQTIPETEPIYIETEGPLNLMGWSPLKGLRTERYKYIAEPANELYDIKEDPLESRNLYSSRPDKVAEMSKLMKRVRSLMMKDAGGADSSIFPDADSRDKLESLGYVSYKASAGQKLENPRDMSEVLKLYYKVEGHTFKNETKEALETAEKALELDPDNVRILEVAAHAAHLLGKYEKSVEYYERLLSINPNVAVAWSDLSSVYSKIDEFDKAETCAREALKVDPKLPHAFIMLAIVADEKGERDNAIANYRQALEYDPDNKYALAKLGAILTSDPATADEGKRMIEKSKQRKK